jgi:hypothetical protein
MGNGDDVEGFGMRIYVNKRTWMKIVHVRLLHIRVFVVS